MYGARENILRGSSASEQIPTFKCVSNNEEIVAVSVPREFEMDLVGWGGWRVLVVQVRLGALRELP
jgi:hypothetical protein